MSTRRRYLKQLAAAVPALAISRYGNATSQILTGTSPGLQGAAQPTVTDVRSATAGIECKIDDTRLRVRFITDRIVRVTATRDLDWSKAASHMIVSIAEGPGIIQTNDNGEAIALRSSQLAVLLNRATGSLSFWKKDGTLLLEEGHASLRTFARVPVFKSVPNPESITRVQTVDGERQVVGAYVQTKDRDAWKASVHFKLHNDEALYGLGFDETDDLNLRGKTKRLYQHNLRVVIPYLVSTRGYGLLFNTYSAFTFADGKDGASVTSDVVDELDYYFVLGPGMDGAIAGYRQLTGAAAMLPKWAFGYVQSRERYTTQAELVATVKQFRHQKIPLDVIVQDWNYWTTKRWGSLVPDATRYPDIAAMTNAVHDLQARVMISIWPNPSALDAPGKAFKDNGYTLAGTDYVDFFRPEAGKLYFDQAWKYLGQYGIDAWWCDSTEPEVADWVSEPVRPKDADEINIRALAKIIDAQYLNAYALVDSQSLYRNWRRTVPTKRMVNLTRSGYAGSQAAGAIIWTGDTSAKWSVFAQQVTAMQSYSASGTPYVTLDIGAFFVRRGKAWFWNGDYEHGSSDLGYRELYTRWLQFGVFLPMLRSHGTDTPREPWHFGAPGTPFYDAILDAIRLRYRLLPYIYSLAGLVHLSGASFIRPVAFAFPDDPKTHDLRTQLLFGEAIMVSPVVAPMYYQANSTPIENAAKTRDVYLPKGVWIDFWTGQSHTGGKTITVEAPLSRIPIHVRAGSVIPVAAPMQYASEREDMEITLLVYPGADGDYTYYEDAGEGWGYERGEYTLTHIHWHNDARKMTVERRRGSFPGMQEQRRLKVLVIDNKNAIANKPVSVMYEGQAITIDLAV